MLMQMQSIDLSCRSQLAPSGRLLLQFNWRGPRFAPFLKIKQAHRVSTTGTDHDAFVKSRPSSGVLMFRTVFMIPNIAFWNTLLFSGVMCLQMCMHFTLQITNGDASSRLNEITDLFRSPTEIRNGQEKIRSSGGPAFKHTHIQQQVRAMGQIHSLVHEDSVSFFFQDLKKLLRI
jgi:hypothetical protein